MNKPFAIGSVFEVIQHGGKFSKFVVDGYNEDMYMQMTNLTKRDEFMTIHPAHAARIAANGSDSGIKVLDTRSLNDIVVRATAVIIAQPKQEEVKPIATVAKTGSKKDRALAIKAANPSATRKELIAMFVEQLDMTPAGASTYASMK